ncbi:ATP-binding protein [Candidatus Nitrososphaera sp. FF02]|uniref:sensor histidine kinase n=1 Tax=Candidatus Nitrososphaera sp. FF02 TaxID=3398226 RepID=UPI0039ECB11E
MAETGKPEANKKASFFRDDGQPSLSATLVKYTLVPAIPLAIIAALSADADTWRVNDTHHFYFELIAVIFATIVAFYGILRARQTKDRFSLMIGLAYLASAVIDALHAAFSFNAANETLFLNYFIPQTWFAGRTFISSVMIIAIVRYAAASKVQVESPDDAAGRALQKGRQDFASFSIIMVTLITAVALTFISFFTVLPSIVIDYPVHRPYEIPPLALFTAALFLFYQKGLYKTNDVFYKGILLSLLFDVFSQIVMSYSAEPFNTTHNVSHVLKNASYFINIIALAMWGIQYNKMVKQNEQVIRSSYERLKAADRIKDDFINIAAHELRTPVLPIMLSAENLVDSLPGDENAKVILRNATRLTKLTNDILDVSRIESGTISYRMEPVRINEVILEVVASQKTNLKSGVQVLTQCDLTNNIYIEADRSRLMQVFTNIVGNALKFTKEGFVRIETLLPLGFDGIEIIISDTGPGIPADVLPNLFGKFVTKNVGMGSYQGTGLGLFISKAIISAHGGRISARNGEKGGAVFQIALTITQNKNRQGA